jgi:hypothetical protein
MLTLRFSAITECQYSAVGFSGLTPVPDIIYFESEFVSRSDTNRNGQQFTEIRLALS